MAVAWEEPHTMQQSDFSLVDQEGRMCVVRIRFTSNTVRKAGENVYLLYSCARLQMFQLYDMVVV